MPLADTNPGSGECWSSSFYLSKTSVRQRPCARAADRSVNPPPEDLQSSASRWRRDLCLACHSGMLSGGDTAGPSLLGSSKPSQLPEPSLQSLSTCDIGCLPAPLRTPTFPTLSTPCTPVGLHPQYPRQGDGLTTDNCQSPWQAAPTGHLCFWPLSQHQRAGQGHEHGPDGGRSW